MPTENTDQPNLAPEHEESTQNLSQLDAMVDRLQATCKRWTGHLRQRTGILPTVPKPLLPLVKALRLDTPAIHLLLVWPMVWGLFTADDNPLFAIIGVTALAFILRAGLLLYDDTQGHTDDQSTSTAKQVPPLLRVALLVILASAGLSLSWVLGPAAFGFTLLWILAAAAHPHMYHITWYPQLYSGLVLGGLPALIGHAAGGVFNLAIIFVFVACILWVAGIETLRASLRQRLDAATNTRSIALMLGRRQLPFVGLCLTSSLLIMALAGALMHASAGFYLCLLVAQALPGQSPWQARASHQQVLQTIRRSHYSAGLVLLGLLLA